jgi:excisionase family DNA binding protein
MPPVSIKTLAELPVTLTTRDVEAFLGVCHSTVCKLLQTPGFPALKVGTHWKVPKDDLLAWMKQQQTQRQEMRVLRTQVALKVDEARAAALEPGLDGDVPTGDVGAAGEHT